VVVSAVDDLNVEQSTESFSGQALIATSTASASASTSQTIDVTDNDIQPDPDTHPPDPYPEGFQQRSLHYRSNLHSGELNWVLDWYPDIRWFCGARYIRFNEKLTDRLHQAVQPPLPGPLTNNIQPGPAPLGPIITVNDPVYRQIGAGFLVLPIAILISLGVLLAVAALTRGTALGMLVESVGTNPRASRRAGVRSRTIVWTVYVFAGLCAGVAGLMISSNVSAADANNAGLWIEMDAILAVVIGGTSLAGGRYSLVGTLVGALVIQTLTTTLNSIGVPPDPKLVFKAVVVIAVSLLQSPRTSQLFRSRRTPGPTKTRTQEVTAA
jgi:hypothetical protein